MSLKIVLDNGDEGEAVAIRGELLDVFVPRAFAPGSPVHFRARLAEKECALRGKTVRVKRQQDGRFALSLRMVSLRRIEREALVALLSDA